MARTGLRRARIQDAPGDPLDGLVNLFDIGIVLAVAFLVAGLGTTIGPTRQRGVRGATPSHTFSRPRDAPIRAGHGEPVGTVYRLNNGSLILVSPRASRPRR